MFSGHFPDSVLLSKGSLLSVSWAQSTHSTSDHSLQPQVSLSTFTYMHQHLQKSPKSNAVLVFYTWRSLNLDGHSSHFASKIRKKKNPSAHTCNDRRIYFENFPQQGFCFKKLIPVQSNSIYRAHIRQKKCFLFTQNHKNTITFHTAEVTLWPLSDCCNAWQAFATIIFVFCFFAKANRDRHSFKMQHGVFVNEFVPVTCVTFSAVGCFNTNSTYTVMCVQGLSRKSERQMKGKEKMIWFTFLNCIFTKHWTQT